MNEPTASKPPSHSNRLGGKLVLELPSETQEIERTHQRALAHLKDAAHEIESAVLLQVDVLVKGAISDVEELLQTSCPRSLAALIEERLAKLQLDVEDL